MTPAALEIRTDDLLGEQTRALLRRHLSGMHASSPSGTVFALDLSALKEHDVTVWSARIGATVVGMAALKQLDDGGGEIKSMRTHPQYLRRGIASAPLKHSIETARSRGLGRVSLETGSGPAFEPALAL